MFWVFPRVGDSLSCLHKGGVEGRGPRDPAPESLDLAIWALLAASEATTVEMKAAKKKERWERKGGRLDLAEGNLWALPLAAVTSDSRRQRRPSICGWWGLVWRRWWSRLPVAPGARRGGAIAAILADETRVSRPVNLLSSFLRATQHTP